MKSSRKQISVATLFVVVTLTAFVICVVALPGGATIYLPALLTLLLALVIWISSKPCESTPRTRMNYFVGIGAITVLAVGAFYYAMFSQEAFAQYEFEKQRAKQRDSVAAIDDYDEFQVVALDYHSRIAPATSARQVFINPKNAEIPIQISELEPTEISACRNLLLIRLKPNGMILIYPYDYQMPATDGYQQLSSRTLYYERR